MTAIKPQMAPSAMIVTPPLRRYPLPGSKPTVFLAGSIEMGKATDWQKKAIKALRPHTSVIYNPRRDDWDSSWAQRIENPQFNDQVNWELEFIDAADFVIVNIEPDTMSPVTLMELGRLTAYSHYKTVVCCPKGFWRKGNVDIMCERYGIEVFEDFGDLLRHVKETCEAGKRSFR